MSHTISVRLTEEQAVWLAETDRRSGLPASRIVREQLEKARTAAATRPWMKYVGSISGLPPDLSSRRGFSRS